MTRDGVRIRGGRRRKDAIWIPERLLPYNITITGSPGTGKSTLFLEIADQIVARGDAAVIFDPKGEFRDRCYDPATDIIFDPTDDRCPYWALEDEAEDEARSTPWGTAFWPSEPNAQPFFKKHPRAIFSYLLAAHSAYNNPKDPATCANMGHWLARGEEEILPRLRGTEHERSLTRGKNTEPVISDKSQGLHTTLGEIAKGLRMMPANPEDRKRFSVIDWERKRPGRIFLTSTPMTGEALRPLHSAIIDLLILASQAPADLRHPKPMIWFLLDEFASSLNTLPQLVPAMAKQRASGCCMVLGIQDHSQVKANYGELSAVVTQTSNNFILRTPAPESSKWLSELLGLEFVEKISVNEPAHTKGKHNRATSYTANQVWEPVVQYTEIQNLPDFVGFASRLGLVTQFRVQRPVPRRVTERIERVMPPLVFREKPQRPVTFEEPGELAPVDDIEWPAEEAICLTTGKGSVQRVAV